MHSHETSTIHLSTQIYYYLLSLSKMDKATPPACSPDSYHVTQAIYLFVLYLVLDNVVEFIDLLLCLLDIPI